MLPVTFVSKKKIMMSCCNRNKNIDLFSKLSNNLIYIIISYLPFKEAARTSVLSTRWRHLWLATKVEFLESLFVVRVDENEEIKELHRSKFVDFARHWIHNYNETIVNTFRLVFSRPVNFVNDVQNFISFAIDHNVKELALDFHDPMWPEYDHLDNHEAVFDLPMHVYVHNKSLEYLELFSCNIVASQFNNFIALKELSLGWIQLSMHSIKELLVHCPLLESLSLKKCWGFECLQITVPNLRLKRLVIDKCDINKFWYEIVAPNLRFFKYSGTEGMFRIETQDSLAEVELDFALQLDFDEEIGEFLYELLRQLEIVKVLTVCSFLLQVIPHAEEPLGMTVPLNVEHLILNAGMHPHEYYGINFMLKSCPFLQTLTINIGPGRYFRDYTSPFYLNPHKCWISNVVVYPCITTSLKVVNVKGFKGTKIEACFLNYLVSFGNVMQELNLYLSDEVDANGDNRETYLQRAQHVQQFRGASVNLHTSIY